MFTQQFGRFVCEGDRITCAVGRFTAIATIYADDNRDPPDSRDEHVMAAWENDEWYYCGVAVTIECEDVQLLGRYDCALWGIECNYPDSDNSYLQEVANELLGEAIEQAKAKLAKLCAE